MPKVHQTTQGLAQMTDKTIDKLKEDLVRKNKLLDEELALLASKKRSLIFAQEVEYFGSWEIDLLTNQAIWSQQSYINYRLDPDKVKPTMDTFFDMIVDEDKPKALETLRQCIDGKIHTVVLRMIRGDGKLITIQINGKYLFDDDGKPIKLIGTTLDITNQVELEQKNQELASIIEESRIEMYIVEADTFGYLYANQMAANNLGYTKDELYSMSIFDINRDLPKDKASMLENMLLEYGYATNKTVHTRKDGTTYPVKSYMQHKIYNGRSVGVIFDIDMSKQLKIEEQIKKQTIKLNKLAYTDQLTGIPNRVSFTRYLDQAIGESASNNDRFALLFIDLDDFKQINDTQGHDYGDELLKIVSKRLSAQLPSGDKIFRLGGDEFTIILKSIQSVNHIEHLTQKLIQAMAEEIDIFNHRTYMSLSIGISIYPTDAIDAKELSRYADLAMYHAKKLRKESYCFFHQGLAKEAHRRSELYDDILNGIANKELIPYYQPQVDMINGELVGIEVLARWHHPTKGFVYPDDFIPFAEETDLIEDIDRYIIEKALNDASQWLRDGLDVGVLAVNLSIKEFEHHDFVQVLSSIVQKSGFDIKKLELEITEYEAMINPDKSIEVMHRLRDMGISVSMDDFGTGYSSLAYLQKLPLDKLKIDRSFTSNLPHNSDNANIVRTIISLARNFGLDIIAEGIENESQQEFFLAEGCRMGQGYYLGKPMSAAKMREYLIGL